MTLRISRAAASIAIAGLAAVCPRPASLRAQTPPVDIAARYRETADRLIDAALADTTAYVRLGRMVDTFGSRFSGSAALERA
ncbi:MAG TPA: hypothetical protein VIE46_04840, partial [Gemmatimonadales bacterium]